MKWITVALAALAAGAILFACAYDPGPFFQPPRHGSAFENGRLGLLVPHLSTRSELLAFRVVNGLKADAADDAASDGEYVNGPMAWITARSEVVHTPVFGGWINTYRSSNQGSSYVFFMNCLDDAFSTAAKTLRDRQKTYASPTDVAAWVGA